MPNEPHRGPVLTTQQAAAYCGMAVKTLRKPARRRHGRLNVFFPEDLDAWLMPRLRVVDAETPVGTSDGD